MMTNRATTELRKAFAPSGRLRASINLGNPVLAVTDKVTGHAKGVSVDLAHALGKQLDLPVEPVVFNTAIESVEAVTNNLADVGFFAIDPLRAAAINFTAPYVLIEGCFLVRDASELRTNDEVDAAGHRVAIGKGSAYDLYLSRELKHAMVVHAPTSAAALDIFFEQHLDVAAGVRQRLEADAQRIGGLRLLPGRFMVIQQAIGLSNTRGADAAAFLTKFVENMKVEGAITDALKRHGIAGATVASMQVAEPNRP
jgi:ABC-type amino acid transport substrate-binding protein